MFTVRLLSSVTGPLRRTSASVVVTARVLGRGPAVEEDAARDHVAVLPILIWPVVFTKATGPRSPPPPLCVAEQHAAVGLRHRHLAQGLEVRPGWR